MAEQLGSAASRRLTPMRDEGLDPEQRAMWDAIAAGPRAATAVREGGQLTGPFDVLLRSPGIGLAVSELGARLRFDSSLDLYETELVIVTVAGHWHARYAWLRHEIYAAHEGIPAEVVAAIARGDRPVLESPRDQALHTVVRQLLATGAVDDHAYAAALAALGERKLIDAVALTGYYCLSSFLLNTFDVPLPVGETAPWDDLHHRKETP